MRRVPISFSTCVSRAFDIAASSSYSFIFPIPAAREGWQTANLLFNPTFSQLVRGDRIKISKVYQQSFNSLQQSVASPFFCCIKRSFSTMPSDKVETPLSAMASSPSSSSSSISATFTVASSSNHGVWKLDSLKFELKRVHYRTFNKIGKLSMKLAELKSNENKGNSDGGISLSNIEASKEVLELQSEMDLLRTKLNDLVRLEKEVKTAKEVTAEISEIVRNIGLNPPAPDAYADSEDGPSVPVIKLKKAESKNKAPPPSPRKPYHVYTSSENIQIYVGRTAEDNDVLSTSNSCRDPREWWMHVAGYPGSHVVIKCTDDRILETHKQTLHDAALLTAHFSKVKHSSRISVHFTRCRNVKKPPGSKPGLVQLSGYSGEINVNLGADKLRLEALLKTKAS